MLQLNEFLKDIKIKKELTTSHDSHQKYFDKKTRNCRSCFSYSGVIRTHGLMMCRRCFGEYAKDIGFMRLD